MNDDLQKFSILSSDIPLDFHASTRIVLLKYLVFILVSINTKYVIKRTYDAISFSFFIFIVNNMVNKDKKTKTYCVICLFDNILVIAQKFWNSFIGIAFTFFYS